MQRREFIKNSTFFGTLAMLGGTNSLFGDENTTKNEEAPQVAQNTTETQNSKIDKFITLNNGVKMPVIGLGTLGLQGDVCENSVKEALKMGYRLIDTAQSYGNEKAVGKGISKSKIHRKDIFIVTKLDFKSYTNTRDAVVKSLGNLQTYYVDMVLLEWPLANYYGAWRELEKLCNEGIIKSIGISNFKANQFLDLVANNKITPALNQIETNLYCQQADQKDWLDKTKIAHMGYSPLGQGKRNEMFSEYIVSYLSEKYKKTPAQILLRFLLQKGGIVIPRSSKIEHIKENFEIFDFGLSKEEMTRLTSLDKKSPLSSNPQDPEFVEKMLFSK